MREKQQKNGRNSAEGGLEEGVACLKLNDEGRHNNVGDAWELVGHFRDAHMACWFSAGLSSSKRCKTAKTNQRFNASSSCFCYDYLCVRDTIIHLTTVALHEAGMLIHGFGKAIATFLWCGVSSLSDID